MLTEEEESKIACLMVLSDLCKKAKEDGHETPELKQTREELEATLQKLLATCSEVEKKNVLARYTEERKNTKSLKRN
jgi:hypothetical protein